MDVDERIVQTEAKYAKSVAGTQVAERVRGLPGVIEIRCCHTVKGGRDNV